MILNEYSGPNGRATKPRHPTLNLCGLVRRNKETRRQCVSVNLHSGEKLHGEMIICHKKVLKPEAIHLPPEHQDQHLNGVCFENGEARQAAKPECPDGFAKTSAAHLHLVVSSSTAQAAPFVP